MWQDCPFSLCIDMPCRRCYLVQSLNAEHFLGLLTQRNRMWSGETASYCGRKSTSDICLTDQKMFCCKKYSKGEDDMKCWETFCDFDSFLYPLILTFTTRIRLCLYLNLGKESCVPLGKNRSI